MLREIRRLPETTVIETWLKLHLAGKHKGLGQDPIASRFIGLDDTWVEVEIPHDQYNAEWNMSDANLSPAQVDRSLKYAAQPGALPPGMATFNGRRKKAYVADGNHRAYAAHLRGLPVARFYMPLKHWERFKAVQANER